MFLFWCHFDYCTHNSGLCDSFLPLCFMMNWFNWFTHFALATVIRKASHQLLSAKEFLLVTWTIMPKEKVGLKLENVSWNRKLNTKSRIQVYFSKKKNPRSKHWATRGTVTQNNAVKSKFTIFLIVLKYSMNENEIAFFVLCLCIVCTQ